MSGILLKKAEYKNILLESDFDTISKVFEVYKIKTCYICSQNISFDCKDNEGSTLSNFLDFTRKGQIYFTIVCKINHDECNEQIRRNNSTYYYPYIPSIKS